jgi:hypothetical protein
MPTQPQSNGNHAAGNGAAAAINGHPPFRINGKQNPAYRLWWRKANPDAYKAISNRAEEARKSRLKELNKRVGKDQCKCVHCDMVFNKEDVILRGYRFLPYHAGHLIVCNECE